MDPQERYEDDEANTCERDRYDRLDEDFTEDEDECCFPGECCMPGPHLRSECHTAEMIRRQAYR